MVADSQRGCTERCVKLVMAFRGYTYLQMFSLLPSPMHGDHIDPMQLESCVRCYDRAQRHDAAGTVKNTDSPTLKKNILQSTK